MTGGVGPVDRKSSGTCRRAGVVRVSAGAPLSCQVSPRGPLHGRTRTAKATRVCGGACHRGRQHRRDRGVHHPWLSGPGDHRRLCPAGALGRRRADRAGRGALLWRAVRRDQRLRGRVSLSSANLPARSRTVAGWVSVAVGFAAPGRPGGDGPRLVCRPVAPDRETHAGDRRDSRGHRGASTRPIGRGPSPGRGHLAQGAADPRLRRGRALAGTPDISLLCAEFSLARSDRQRSLRAFTDLRIVRLLRLQRGGLLPGRSEGRRAKCAPGACDGYAAGDGTLPWPQLDLPADHSDCCTRRTGRNWCDRGRADLRQCRGPTDECLDRRLAGLDDQRHDAGRSARH